MFLKTLINVFNPDWWPWSGSRDEHWRCILSLELCICHILFVSRHLCFVDDSCDSPDSSKQIHFPWIFNGMGWMPDAWGRKSDASQVISLKSFFICSSCILSHILCPLACKWKGLLLRLFLSHCCPVCFASVALCSFTLWFISGHVFCVCVWTSPRIFGMVPVDARQLHFQSQWQDYALAFLSWAPFKGLCNPAVLVHSVYNWIGLTGNRIQD